MEYAPSSVFIGAQSLWERDAEHFAFDELVDNLPSTSGVSSNIEQSESQICDICCCEKSCIALSCGHFFCEECWIRHAVICLKHNHIPIKCPAYNCDSFLEVEHMMVFMPLSECDRYSMLLGKKHLMGPQWIRCLKCPRVLHRSDKEQQSRTVVSLARCACGTAMCAHCGGIGHAPMTCNAAAEYEKILRMNGQTLINVNDKMTILVKKCPGCGSFCQRASGCNQMHCSCDTNFCYMCGSRWTPSHYNCTHNVDVLVHLIDVPKAASHHFSTKVFNRCAIFRYARSPQYMLTLKKDLRKLPLTFVEYEHAIDAFKAVSEVLEILEVHMYNLRRCNRTKRADIYNALHVHIGSLKHFSNRLRNMFIRICRNNKKTSEKVGDIVFKIKHILRLLMLEAL